MKHLVQNVLGTQHNQRLIIQIISAVKCHEVSSNVVKSLTVYQANAISM